MATSIFLSHTSVDKPFVRRLARDLENQGFRVWLDEAEIKVGQSLIETIGEGICSIDYLAVVISPDSIKSAWVQREVHLVLDREVRVLPIMYRRCDMPGYLHDTKHADFTDSARYDEELANLVRSMGLVFNRQALITSRRADHLGRAADKAAFAGLRILSKPFHRPFQHIGMPVAAAATAASQAPNEAGNIVIDTNDCHMLLESEGNFISYVEIELKQAAPHRQNQEFDSEPILGALSINPAELELVRQVTHCHTYCDHRKKLKITVGCMEEEGPISVGFSTKYYGV